MRKIIYNHISGNELVSYKELLQLNNKKTKILKEWASGLVRYHTKEDTQSFNKSMKIYLLR